MSDKDLGVVVAKTAGFCPGVKKAIDCVLGLARQGKSPIYTLGPLIHNTQVIQTLEEKNIHAVKSVAEIKDKKSVLVIRAHGITPELEAEIRATGLEVVDSTCPLVKNAQAVISKYAALGYHTVIVGDNGHAEVVGLRGYAAAKGHVVADAAEAERLPHFDKVNVVAQTTQEELVFAAVAEAVKKKSGECVVSNTICNPTRERQSETAALAKTADMMIIVGGKHSANSARLAKLCGERCRNTVHIETEEELENIDVSSVASIVITAGASTPSWMTDRVANWVKRARRPVSESVLRGAARVWSWVINSCVYSAFAAMSLSWVCIRLQGAPRDGRILLLAGLFVLSLNIINRAFEKGIGVYDRDKLFIFQQHRLGVMLAGLLAGVSALALAFSLGPLIFWASLSFWFLGALYPFRDVLKLRGGLNFPGSKDIVTALGWGFVCACIPALYQQVVFKKANDLAVLYAFLFVFMRSVMLGVSAVQTDMIVGRENFYKALGPRITQLALFTILVGLTAILALLAAMGWKPQLVTALLAGNAYTFACFAFYHRGKMPRSIWAETIIDGQFIFLGALALAAQYF